MFEKLLLVSPLVLTANRGGLVLILPLNVYIYEVFAKKKKSICWSCGWKCSGSGRGGQLEVGVNSANSVLVRSQNEEMEKVKKTPAKWTEGYRKLSAP